MRFERRFFYAFLSVMVSGVMLAACNNGSFNTDNSIDTTQIPYTTSP